MSKGHLVGKNSKNYPVLEFSPPDRLVLHGDFAPFETSLAKSVRNGYILMDCDDPRLLKYWEQQIHA